MVLLSISRSGGSMSAGKENTPVPGSGSESAQSNREDQYMGGAKDMSQSQSTGEETSVVVSYAPSTERSSVLSNKVTSLLKEKYAGARREECEDRVDVDSVNSDNEGMPNGMHDMENLSLYHSPPPGNLNSGMTDGSLHEFALQRHRLGLMSDMRNKPLSPETSELLRGILQGKEKRLQEHMSSHGNCGDTALISKLLHGEGDPHLLHNGGFDGEDSLQSGSPGNISLDDSDLENTNSQDAMNGSHDHDDCEFSPGGENKRKLDDSSSTGDSLGDSQEAKRARVENIITMMQSPTLPSGDGNNSGMEQRRPKRKQYIPQQHDVYNSEHSSPKVRKLEQEVIKKQLKLMQDQLSEMQQRYSQIFDFEASDPSDLSDFGQGGQRSENRRLNGTDSDRVENNKDIIKKPGFGMGDRVSDYDPSHFIKQANKLVKEQEFVTKHPNPVPTDIKNLAKTLKSEITNSVGALVDSIVARYVEQQKTSVDKQTVINLADSVKEKLIKSPPPAPEEEKPRQNSPKPVRTKVTDKINHPLMDLHKNLPDMPRMHPAMQHLFAPPPYFTVPHLHSLYPKEPEQAEPLSLVMNTPKKKRTKVTDTRLSPRAARALLQENLSQHGDSDKMPMPHHPHHHMPHTHHHHHGHQDGFHPPLVPVTLPTSVAIPNPSLQHSEVLAMYSHNVAEHKSFEHGRNSNYSPNMGDHGSPNMGQTASEGLSMSMMKVEEAYEHHQHSLMMGETHAFDGTPMTSTLTPMHLRKAKLMFFYTRYPSSAILKIYFPDVKFNKNNTAQLVKWFSNFREFFYIQMEKYARQAMAEGMKNYEELIVTLDHELYRVLNLHYNRNNQIEVPDHFRVAVQSTLREFFKAIVAGKDTEQSWKKSIYKVIARMDDTIPEYFKSPNWMEQLSDM